MDRRAWECAVRKGDVFDPGGPAGLWRPATRRLVSSSYGAWLAFLQENELLEGALHPGDRVTLPLVARYIETLKARCRDTTTALRLHQLAHAVRVLAPDRDFVWLRRIATHVQATIRTRKNKLPRIYPSDRLFQIGLRMMRECESAAANRLVPAMRYRDGLIIALLASRPLRLSNFASLRIGETLVQDGQGRWVIELSGEETKTGERLEMPLPDLLFAPLDCYLKLHRPRLLGAARHAHLWISVYGDPLGPQAIRSCVSRWTKHSFGVAISPHLFRDCAATSIAIQDPEHVRMAAAILGHRSLETTMRYYNQAKTLEAGRVYQGTIRKLRRRSTAVRLRR